MAANNRIKWEILVDGDLQTGWVATLDGQTMEFDVTTIPEEIQRLYLFHGMKQKLGDAANRGTEAEKIASMMAIYEANQSGDWDLRGGTSGLLTEALANLAGIDVAAVKAKLDGMTDTEKKKLEGRKDVKTEILRIRLARMEANNNGGEPEEFAF